MDKRTFLVSLVFATAAISLLLNGALVFLIVKNSQLMAQQAVNEKVLNFRNMFTEKVLLSTQEIDIDARVALETAVRATEDQQIINLWKDFSDSATKEEATATAKALLSLLVKKTSY